MKIIFHPGSVAFILIALSACSPPIEGENAEITAAKKVTEIASSTEYAISLTASTVNWVGRKPTGQHIGHIPLSEGSIAVHDNAIIGGKVILDLHNIQNKDLVDKPEMQKKLITHLKSADFFHVDSFPTAEFIITSTEPYIENKPMLKSLQKPTHTITGNLTMRGKPLSVAFPATITMNEDKLTALAKFNIDRSRWGLNYQNEASVVDRAKDKFIYNSVLITFGIEAYKTTSLYSNTE